MSRPKLILALVGVGIVLAAPAIVVAWVWFSVRPR